MTKSTFRYFKTSPEIIQLAAMREIGNARRRKTGRHLSNRPENSHLPFRRRERAMSRFRRMRSLKKFVSIHSSVYNHFRHQRNI